MEKIIKLLHQSDAIRFGNFTLKSKRQSPFFINIELATRTSRGLYMICNALAEQIKEKVGDVDFIFGSAYKGISLAAGVALRLYSMNQSNIQWGHDRKETKTHGDLENDNGIGDIPENANVVIVDDVLTTSSTKLEAVNKIKFAQPSANIKGIFVVVDREESTIDDVNFLIKAGAERISSLVKITEVINYHHVL